MRLSLLFRVIGASLAVVLIGLASACGGASTSGCAADKDCKTGMVCRDSGSGKVCVQDTTPSCPTTCSADADCSKCNNGNTSCVSGACGKKTDPPACPTTCNGDADCAKCDGGRTTCKVGACAQPTTPPACPTTCSKNEDCASCEGGRTTCENSACVAKTTPTCPSSCAQDSDCTPCGTGFKCDAGQCKTGTPPAGKKPGEECDDQNSCVDSASCIEVSDTKALCFQDCTSDKTLCSKNTNGVTSCIEFASDADGNAIFVCLKEAAEGEKCYLGGEQADCKAGLDPALYCSSVDGTCKAPQVQKNEGDPCNKSTDDSEPFKVCDKTAGLGCSEKDGKCVKGIEVGEGEECDSTGSLTGTVSLCKAGFECIEFDTGTQRCHKKCDAADATSCSHNAETKCVGSFFSDGKGLCLDSTCNTGADCAFKDYLCETQNQIKACWPPAAEGPKTEAQLCKEPVRIEGCKGGLECIVEDDTSVQGFCARDCSGGGSCPEFTDAKGAKFTPTCTPFDDTFSACMFECDNNAPCPDGLVCKDIGGNYCVAP